jgi:hypothetical protein
MNINILDIWIKSPEALLPARINYSNYILLFILKVLKLIRNKPKRIGPYLDNEI